MYRVFHQGFVSRRITKCGLVIAMMMLVLLLVALNETRVRENLIFKIILFII
jgi:uncharacterized membrane protein